MSKTGSETGNSKTPLIFALESRLLFDGDLGTEAAAAIVYRDGTEATIDAVAPENQRENLPAADADAPVELVFIDNSLEDLDTLVTAIPEGSEIYFIDSASDGFDQIAGLLDGRDSIDAIHIIGHGRAGEVLLGTASLSSASLTEHTEALTAMRNALDAEGDILLYGCNIGETAAGESFIEELAELTAADIAASDDVTGASGDWELEYQSGSIEAEAIEALEYKASLNPDGVSSMTNTVEKTASNLNVKAKADHNGQGTGFYDGSQERFVIALEKSDITSSKTLYFDFGVSVGQNGTYTVSESTPVASYMVALNNDVGRRSSGQLTVVFENDILGYYVHKENTLGSGTMVWYDASANGGFSRASDGDSRVTNINNNYFSNSGWIYPSSGQINRRDAEGYMNKEFGTGRDGGADYVWTDNNRTFRMAAKNGNESGVGDFVRVITKWPSSNNAPTAADETITISEDSSHKFVEGDFNYSDADSDAMDHVTIVTLPGSGTLELSGVAVNAGQEISTTNITNGNLEFIPDANENGDPYTSFTFSVNDGSEDSASNYTMTIDVTPANDAPTAADNSVTFAEGTGPYTFSASEFNFADIDGDSLHSIRIDSLHDTGIMTLNGVTFSANTVIAANDISTLKYNLPINNNGVPYTTFTFSVNDGTRYSGSSYTMTINVTPVNDAPTAADNTVTTNEDTAHTFSAGEFNFADIDGDSLAHVTIATLPDAGTLTLDGNAVSAGDDIAEADIGNLEFTPATNASGDPYTSFTFSVNDGTADSASTYTMTVDVTPVNDAPTAADNTVTTDEDTAHTFSAGEFNFADVEGDSLDHVTIVAGPAAGALTLNGNAVNDGDDIAAADIGNLVFTPANGGSGNGYASFTFSVNDGAADSDSNYTMTINVTPAANNAPTAADNTVTTNEDTAHTFSAGEFNFADDDGHSLDHVTIVAGPAAGALTLNGNAVNDGDDIAAADIGNLVFTPVANANGDPYTSFTFTVNDGNDDSASTYTMTIDVTPINDAPTSADNSKSTAEDMSLRFSSTDFAYADIDGDSRAVTTILTLPDKGYLTQNGGLKITNAQLPFGLNDSALNQLTYHPDANESGDPYTSFTFSVNDGTNDSASTYTMTISVTPRNDPPTAANNAVTIDEDTSHTFSAGEFNFSDIDGDSLDHVTIVDLPDTVNLTLNGNPVSSGDDIAAADIGNLVFTPAANATNTHMFSFTVNDGTADSATRYFTINITPVNDAPTAADNTITTNEDTAHTFSAGEFNFADVDGDSLDHVTIVAGPAAGALTLNGNAVNDGDDIAAADIGNLVFTPAADANGDPYTSFTFSVNDGTADSASTYTMTMDVTAVNDAPTIDPYSTSRAKTADPLTFNLLTDANADDVDTGDTVSLLAGADAPAVTATQDGNPITLPDGAVSISGSDVTVTPGSFPDLGDNDSVVISIAYKVSDGTAAPVDNTATITITGENNEPTIIDDNGTPDDSGDDVANAASITTDEDTAHNFTADDFNYVDPDGDALDSITIATLPDTGQLTLNGAAVNAGDVISAADIANLTFTPLADENGAPYTSFTFTVSDGIEDSATGTMTINVSPVNDAPQIIDDNGTPDDPSDDVANVASISTPEDTPHAFTADDFNFADIDDGDALASVKIISLPDAGVLALNGNPVEAGDTIAAADLPNLTFTPDADETGAPYTDFTYSVNDGTDDSPTGTMSVTVTPENDAPEIINDNGTPDDPSDDVANTAAITTDEDTPHSFSADDFNYSDPENDPFVSVTIASLPDSGKLTLGAIDVAVGDVIAAGDLPFLTFTPDENENGAPYSDFTYTVSDGTNDSATGTMTVNVTPANDAPEIIDDNGTPDDPSDDVANIAAVNTDEDTPRAFSPDDFNFTDIDGDTLASITIATLPDKGDLTLDGRPVEAGDSIAAADIDKLVFTPENNKSGDAYTDFTFRVNDGTDDSAGGTMVINVAPVNDAPKAKNDTLEIVAGNEQSGSVTANDRDDDGRNDERLVTDIDGNLPGEPVTGIFGTLTVNEDGTFTYVADSDAALELREGDSGSDSFTYTIADEAGATDTATLTITVNGLDPDNRPPVAVDDIVFVDEGKRVNGNAIKNTFGGSDSDPDRGNTLSISSIAANGVPGAIGEAVQGEYGELTVNSGGKFNYRARAEAADALKSGETVTDSFTYTLADGSGGTDTATIFVNVIGINDAPKANTDNMVVSIGDTVSGDVLTNDTDADTDNSELKVVLGDQTSFEGRYGTLTLAEDGSFTYEASGNPDRILRDGETVEEVFAYTIEDGWGGSDEAKIKVTVAGINNAPTATGTKVTSDGLTDTDLPASVFGYEDFDDDPLGHVTIVTLPESGTLLLNGTPVTQGQDIAASDLDGLVFRAPEGAAGEDFDSFTYTVNDGALDSEAPETISFDVSAAPRPSAGSETTEEDTPVTGFLDYVNPTGDEVTFAISQQPENGSVELINGGPGYVYTPNANYYGDDMFEFTVTNSVDTSLPGRIDIAVTPVNDVPSASSEEVQFRATEEQNISFEVAKIFDDIDRLDPAQPEFADNLENLQAFTPTAANGRLASPPASGTLTYSAEGLPDGLRIDSETGEITGSTGEIGSFTVNVTATDGGGLSVTTPITINVSEKPTMPMPEKIVVEEVKIIDAPVEEKPTELSEHDMVPVLKVKPKEAAGNELSKGETGLDDFRTEKTPTSDIADNNELADDSWTMTRASSEMDLNGNIKIVDLEVKNETVEVKLSDSATDKAEQFSGELSDGSPLPDWVTVDPTTGTTSVDSSRATGDVDIRVIAKSGGNERSIDLSMNMSEIAGADAPAASQASQQSSQAAPAPVARPEPVQPTIAPISEPTTAQAPAQPTAEAAPTPQAETAQPAQAAPEQPVQAPSAAPTADTPAEAPAAQQEAAQVEADTTPTEPSETKPAEPAPAENVIADTQNTPTAPQAAPGQADATTTDTDVNVGNDGLVTFTDTTAGDANGGMKLVETRFNDGQLAIDIQDDLRQQVERYEVRMKDGSAAPEWVSVDTQTGQLIVDAPDGVDDVELVLVAVDESGGQRTMELVLEIDELREAGEEPTDAPANNDGASSQTIDDNDLSGTYETLDRQIEQALASADSYGERVTASLEQMPRA